MRPAAIHRHRQPNHMWGPLVGIYLLYYHCNLFLVFHVLIMTANIFNFCARADYFSENFYVYTYKRLVPN